MIRNSKIENFSILDELKLSAFNQNCIRFMIVRLNHNKIFVILSILLRETH